MLTRDSHNPDLQIQQKTSTVTISDFSGGVNLADSPLSLKPNQLIEMTNWQYAPTGSGIEVRDGAKLMTTNVGSAVPLYSKVELLGSDDTGILFSTGGAAYSSTTAGVVSSIGALTGESVPVIEPWGDPLTGYLTASGGKLQYILSGEISTVDTSPDCDIVSKIGGRVVISGSDGARVYFSGIGDHTNWVIDSDTWTDADALWVDIGYKSGGNISALTKIDKDLVIFKTDGIVYKLTGDYPDWHIFEVGHNVKNVNPFSAVQYGNDVVFIDEHYGIHMLSLISDFGDMKVSRFGREVNTQFLKELGNGARVWNVMSRGELWAKPANGSKKIYVYNSVSNCWGIFTFPLEPISVLSAGREVYLSMQGTVSKGGGNLIYTLDHDTVTEVGTAISASLTLRPIHSDCGRVLLNRSVVSVDGSGAVTLSANDHALVSSKTVDGAGRFLSHQVIMGDDVRMSVDATGKVQLNKVSVEYVEV